jgi:ATP-binding cassette subfamily G (WHITE) protein 2 (SNQ2)
LAASGQTIFCTIHQPSAALFEAFDVLMLLARGGRTTYFGETGKDSSILLEYFARNGAACPQDTNPAEHIVDVVQGRLGDDIDWPQTWLDSPEHQHTMSEIHQINTDLAAKPQADEPEDTANFATPIRFQILLVTKRQLTALWRNPDYIWNKIGLHVTNSLFAGFTFWQLGDSSQELQLRLMSVFNFVFVAPGCINQLQPLFISNRDIFESREKKSKTYHWLAFITAQLISEIPALIVCATLFFACWYFTSGLPVKASTSGQVYLQMIFYEFLYTSLGQAIAAYSPNAYFAALANPVIVGAALINFCGVVVPYSQIQVFWRYWMYYLDPFTYLIGGLLEPVVWDVQVHCKQDELTTIPLPSGETCGSYMAEFLGSNVGYIVDPNNSTSCEYCQYTTGADYLRTMNINEKYYGWRDVGITALFCFSTYGLVFLMMKLRSKATKTAG